MITSIGAAVVGFAFGWLCRKLKAYLFEPKPRLYLVDQALRKIDDAYTDVAGKPNMGHAALSLMQAHESLRAV